MLNGIYSSAHALQSATLQHEIVANNLANINTPGFRRTLLSIESRELQAQSPAERGPSQPILAVIDFQPGPHHRTGRNLDVAIEGPGFFTLEGPRGPLYTRNGSFHINDQQVLVSAEGRTVLADGGPVTVPPGTDASQLTISPDGNVRAGDIELGTLDLVDFADLLRLMPRGAATFAAPLNAEPIEANGRLIQGALEQANTQAVTEMIQLIVASRHFESAQRALRTISDAIEQHVNMD